MVKRKVQVNTEYQYGDRTDNDLLVLHQNLEKEVQISTVSLIANNMKEIKNDFSKSEREEDEFDIFEKYIATQLTKLSTEQAILAQEEIQKVVTKCRLVDLKYRNTSYSHAPASSNTFSMSPASTTDTQTTDDSLNLFCEESDYCNIIMNGFNNA